MSITVCVDSPYLFAGDVSIHCWHDATHGNRLAIPFWQKNLMLHRTVCNCCQLNDFSLNGLLRELHKCLLFMGEFHFSLHSFFMAVKILMFPEFRGCILPVTESHENKTALNLGIGNLAFLCDHASETESKIFCIRNKDWKQFIQFMNMN